MIPLIRRLIACIIVLMPTLSFSDEPMLYFWNVKTDYFDLINFVRLADGLPQDFNINEKTVILVHGFSESIHSGVYKDYARWIKQYEPKTNVLAIDWLNPQNVSWSPSSDPVTTSSVIPKVAQWAYRKLFYSGSGLGLCAQRLHIIGFSHGAHVAALIGKHADGNIAHLTLLDPSPAKSHVFSWENFLGAGWKTEDSAKFIDMYKTSYWAATHSPRGMRSFRVQEKGANLNERSIEDVCKNHYYALYWYLSTIGKQYDEFGYSIKIKEEFLSEDAQWVGTILSTLPNPPNAKDYSHATDALITPTVE